MTSCSSDTFFCVHLCHLLDLCSPFYRYGASSHEVRREKRKKLSGRAVLVRRRHEPPGGGERPVDRRPTPGRAGARPAEHAAMDGVDAVVGNTGSSDGPRAAAVSPTVRILEAVVPRRIERDGE